ncbi:response regulator [Sulfurimonas aquatica]|uniref:Response regulator n=1 Tax=Sulfurimonas aquatica TaxID=2672570 RepID=A0A975B2A1_9BACT|nr:response regulator [Sulfurimonas aquatica]QSZ42823.1 response regulator [Sulfurimonas aquatica]
MNILIVDDSKISRHVLSSAVSRYFDKSHWKAFKTFEAQDGIEALEVMKKERIDIMFLDWNMPNMNGEEVVDRVREHKEWNRIRIVMATTDGTKKDVLKMIRKGANGYLVKPFNENTIFTTLDKITARMASK